jgi:hypothetical protein
MNVTDKGVVVAPTRDWAVYHHPTSFTGIGKGKALDRGAHYVTETDEGRYVMILRERLDVELDKRMGRVRAKKA